MSKLSSFLFLISPLVSCIVEGQSMLPTFSPGMRVVVKKIWFFTRIKSGDVVVAKDPRNGKLILKRVQHINEKGQLFLLGDNQEESTDSRTFGFVARKNTIGKVIGR